MVLGASGYLGNTIYKKFKECTNDNICGTCYKSDNHELLQIDVLNILDIKKVLSFKPNIIIWSIMNQEQEMLLSQIGVNEIVNNISKDVRLIYVSTTVGTANLYASFVNVQDLADAIIELAYSKFTGIINISGENPVSHYDFNIYLAELMNIDNSFIISDYKKEDIYHNLNNDKRKYIINTIIRDI